MKSTMIDDDWSQKFLTLYLYIIKELVDYFYGMIKIIISVCIEEIYFKLKIILPI